MTSPADVVQNLLKLGVAVHAAYTDAANGGSLTFSDFLSSKSYGAIEAEVTALLQSLDDDSIQKAIDGIDQKRSALLHGRAVSALSSDELTQYFGLLKARSTLVSDAVSKRSQWRDFLSWVSTTALPDLASIAKVVVPLLL
jgi:DNA-binding MurR/RpiR family transcriptional regulator